MSDQVHVTAVLADILPCWKADDWYLQRGRAVHACAAMIAREIEFEFDPQIAGQVEAIRRFFREVKPTVLEIERRVESRQYGYVGTFDLLAEIGGKKVLVDYKASLSASLPYQLAAYALAWGGTEIRWGVGVEIKEDGTYRMTKTYDLRRFRAGWLALLGAYRIRRECGITKGENRD